jgi:hypothetical protein
MAALLPMLPGYRLIDGSQYNLLNTVVNNLSGNGTPGPVTGTTGTFSGAVSVGSLTGLAPIAAGATKTLTAANSGSTVLLNTAAGSVVTLPAATGTGNFYRFVVSTTCSSNAHKILTAPITDTLAGFTTGENANTAKCFPGATASGYHSIQMPFAGTQPSGGFEGDWFEFIDIASGKWQVTGCYQAGTTPTTPFSTATT